MALGCQLRHFLFMLHLSLHLSLFAVFSDLSISPFIFLPAFIHQLTLHCLISVSANLLCLNFPLSALSCQSLSPLGDSEDLNAFGCCWRDISSPLRVFSTQPGDIKQVTTPDLPLMINENIYPVPDDVDEGETEVTWVAAVFRPPDILC